jgi:PHD/YefM family antitoxin component YafN of YafNO toxin-antitoxin module
MKTQTKNPEIIMRDGKPVAVILDIDIYEQMLEQIEGIEDLEYLEKIRQQPLEFRSLDDFLNNYSTNV